MARTFLNAPGARAGHPAAETETHAPEGAGETFA